MTSAQFSPDGTNIVSASQDKTVLVWSGRQGSVRRDWRAQQCGAAQFSPDGTNIVSASGTRLCVWSVATGECVQTLGAQRCVMSAQFARMARISYRRVGQDCARVERGDRGVCVEIGGAAVR